MNCLRSIACICIVTSFATYGMSTFSGKDNPKIAFYGEIKYLLDYIHDCQFQPNYHKFGTTSVIRFANNVFTKQGDILDLTENDLSDVRNGNWVYTSYYASEKTRLSCGRHERIGAVILGTTDKNTAYDLQLATFRNIVNNSKK